jgi:hypothetical protein
MRSEVEEDVALRLADSASRQLRGNDIVVHHWKRARPASQAGILEAIGIGYSKPLSIEHDLFFSLKRKLEELESG